MANFRDIYFNGRNLQSFGWYVTKDTPVRYSYKLKHKTTPLIGAINGEGVTEDDKVENVIKKFTFKTMPNKIPFDNEELFLNAFEKWLKLNQGKYSKFIDTAKKGCYTEAIITEVSDIERPYKGCFKVTITFSCKPFYYLEKIDEIYTTTIANTAKTLTINNFENETAYPYIKIYQPSASATTLTPVSIVFNGTTLTIRDDNATTVSSVEIDSETMRVYSGNTSLDFLTIAFNLPKLVPGMNTLVITTNTNANVEINPRWRCS